MCTSHRSFTIAIIVAFAMCSHTLGAQRRTDSARPSGELDRVTFAPELHVDLAHSSRNRLGVYLRDVIVGRGDTLRSHATVTLRIYTRLPDGTSVGPGETQLTVRYLPGIFLPGVEQGIRGMRVGGLRQLVLPPSLGYAATHGPEIPSKTPLVVVVELLSVL